MKSKLVTLAVIALMAIMTVLAASCTPTETTPTTTLPPVTQTPTPTITTPPPATQTPTPTTTTPPLPPPMPAARGTLEVRVTDAPAADNVTSIMVTLNKVEIHRAAAIPTPPAEPSDNTTNDDGASDNGTGDNDDTEEGQWFTVNIPAGLNRFDLMEIKGIEKTIGTNEMPIGKYTQVRLTVELIEVALNGGELKPATVPSGVLKLVHPFEITANGDTILVIDFDAEKSVNVTGNGEIKVSPVIKLIVK